MIVEYIRYRIPEAESAAFVIAYEIAAESLRASSHCLAYDLSRCTEAPESFVLRIHWDSAEGHLQGFRKSAEFQGFFAAIKPYVGNIEEMRHYEPTKLAWARA